MTCCSEIALTKGAVPSVPPLAAHAGAILALAVFRAAGVAGLLIALGAGPVVVAPESPPD